MRTQRASSASDAAANAPLLPQPAATPAPADSTAGPRALRTAGRAQRTERALWASLHLPGIDAAQLTQLATAAQRFTPRVSLAPPDGLLLEVQGSLHLFAGLEGLRAELLKEGRARNPRAVLAFAPIASAALVAARAGQALAVTDLSALTGQLAPLPLTALRWPQDTLARLKRMGVRTLGAVLRLPRAGFARRFGSAPLADLDALTGRAPEVRPDFQPVVRFRRRRELPYELESLSLLGAALAPLFAALEAFLSARQYGVLEFECRFRHRQVQDTCCQVRLAAPASDVRRLAALLDEQLGTITLPEPARGCELRVDAPLPYHPDNRSLWQPGEHGGCAGTEAAGLIERLRARLGADAVHGLALCDGHRPEKAWARGVPPTPTPTPAARRGAAARGLMPAAQHRPLWLLAAPQPLRMRHGLPRRRGPLRLVSEPERIETGWWDGEEIARDYYTAVDIHGVRLWVFRERAAPHGWYLHGVFG